MRRVSWGVVIGLFAAWGCGPKTEKMAPPPREVEVFTVSPGPVRETGEYLGSLISRKSVDILPLVAGYVRNIAVRPGDRVKAGAVLLEVDARQESAALESAQAQQRSAQSNLELARQTVVRTRALYDEGLVSTQELERAQAAVAAAEATARSAAAQVSQRRVQLQYFAVTAPFAGTVGDILVRIGDFVNASTHLTSLAQAEVLEVSVAVPAARAREVKPETALEILGADGQVLLTTSVYFVAPQADPRTQLVDVKAVFQNTVGLRPSELVRARLIYSTRQALQVPALAVVRQSGQPFIFAVQEKDGKAVVSRRPVTLGPLGAKAYVVEGGLAEGDRVAVSSLQALRDGAPIKPKPVPGLQAVTGAAGARGRAEAPVQD